MIDPETKFYYLQSRYYDPEICRFINADGYVTTGQGLLSHNIFAPFYSVELEPIEWEIVIK